MGAFPFAGDVLVGLGHGRVGVDRAIVDGVAHGYVKVLTVPGKDRILGITIVGEHAADLLAEFVLAMKHGIGLNKILGTIHTYPTLSEANKFVAGTWKRAHAPQRLLPGSSASMRGDVADPMAPPMPALCIVVPVLDEARDLALHLGELQRFRKAGARVVVVDGGSSDGSLATAAGLADLAFVAPRGRARQMNAGASACTADLLLFLHADTRLPHDADALVQRATSAGRDWGRFDVAIDSPRPLMRIVAAMMNRRSRWTGIATGDQAMFVRQELCQRVGGFPDQPLMEDVALSTLLKRHGPPACLREQVTTSARRWERYGPWRTILLMWRLRAAYFFGADPAKLAVRYGYRAPPR